MKNIFFGISLSCTNRGNKSDLYVFLSLSFLWMCRNWNSLRRSLALWSANSNWVDFHRNIFLQVSQKRGRFKKYISFRFSFFVATLETIHFSICYPTHVLNYFKCSNIFFTFSFCENSSLFKKKMFSSLFHYQKLFFLNFN